jgi:hypothetical protein
MKVAGHNRPSGKRGVRHALARQREVATIDLRARGWAFSAIGEHLGITREAARRAYHRGLARLIEDNRETIEQQRAIVLRQLAALLDGVWDAATGGDLQAVDRALRILERRSRLLGLDEQPEPEARALVIDVVVPEPGRIGGD